MAAARLGVSVRALIGVDAEAASASEIDVLRAAGVDVALARLHSGPVFDNRQTSSGRVQVAHSVSDPIPIAALPAAWPEASAVLLGPIAGELSDDWSGVFPESTLVALAVQGLVRSLSPGKPVQPVPLRRTALIERAEALLISAEDVAAGAPSLTELLNPGQQLVVTHGPSGAMLLRRHASGISGRYLPPLPRRHAIDTTGAGDTFLAAWMAAWLLSGVGDWRALAVASAMASLSVERRSLEDMPTLAEVCEVLFTLRDQQAR
jgi:sugar/nucleoside kinase (ribokinase family)